MRRALALLLVVLLAAVACHGTTGYALVTFYAAASGPADAVKGKPYAFDLGGARVTLTRASLHVGALYLTQSVPTSGGGPAPCTLPGTYDGVFVGEVRGGGDVDLLDPSLQELSVVGQGSTIHAATGQVWLMHGDVNAASDPLPVLSLEGSVSANGASHTFAAAIPIDGSQATAPANSALPGENPICLQRIVAGIPADLTLAQGGTLRLRVDPKALLANADLTALSPCPGGTPADLCFASDGSDQPSTNLLDNLRGAGPYAFEWMAHGLDAGPPPSKTGGSCTSVAAPRAADGFALTPSPCVDSGSLGPGQMLVTASGESLARQGYDFPSALGTFADGWKVTFTHAIATFDQVTLASDPDLVPTDQSKHGAVVAELDGPFAVDLHLDGAAFPYLDGKETGARAVALAVLRNENRNGGAAFPTDGTRLAIGYSFVVATSKALNVNLDADGLATYEAMVSAGCTVEYRGTATWVGSKANGGLCADPSDAADAGPGDGTGNEPEFARLPQVVDFDLCYKPAASAGLRPGDPETTYVNCDNQDNDPAAALNGEPHERGIAFKANTYVVGEVTLHTDHPFWESTKHDTPARFDAFAARAVGLAADGGVPVVHLEDVRGVDYTAFTDREGNVLPWRTCDPAYQNPNGGSRIGPMHYDPVGVPHCTGGNPATGLCDYYDFSKYDQSTQGHWNGADGLCFVQRHYPSPP